MIADLSSEVRSILSEVRSILSKLELDPNVVREFTIRAKERTVEVEVFELDEDGKKFIRPDGFVATQRMTFRTAIRVVKVPPAV